MKNIVCEACNEICQYVCYHKTNFSPIKGTDINTDCRLSHFYCPVARAFIHIRDGVVWCEKCKREAWEFDEHGERSIRELEEQQNKKRRTIRETSRNKEETRGQAEDRIAMQLATDESLAAELEEDGGGGQGDH